MCGFGKLPGQLIVGGEQAWQFQRCELSIAHHHATIDDAVLDPGHMAEHERCHRIMQRACETDGVQRNRNNVRRHSGRQRTDVVAIQDLRAAQRRQLQRLPCAHRRWTLDRSMRHPLQKHRHTRFPQHVRAIVRRTAIHADRDIHPRINHLADRCDARRQPHVRARAMRDAGAGARKQMDAFIVQLHAVRMPGIAAGPAELLGVLGGRAVELLARVGDVVVVLGQVGVQRHAVFARQQGRVAHQLAAHRKRRAGRDDNAAHCMS